MCVTMLLFLLLSLLLHTDGQEFRCLYYRGKCVNQCPRNMHPYHTRCDLDAVSQRTCDSRYVFPIGFTCGWSRCDCNGALLLDETAGTCVPEDQCTAVGRGRDRRKRKRLRFPEEKGGSEEMVSHIG